ncbi:MAG: hypothetical protein MUC35_05515 [Candidatus Margulisbacteria bacterium]|jgi:hypothetical protein|nr:hypothetical protein [Candidatus Margulisiibacteriota bacterium]
MVQTYLINLLIFCTILLVIALVVGAVQLIMILVDVRKMTHEVKEKVMFLTGSVVGTVALAVKKGVELLFKK